MKIRKLILPMMALICAIGMAFTSVNLVEEPETQANDYILVNGTWQAIDEQNCTGLGFTCQVQYGTNGPRYDIYDEMDDAEPKTSGTEDPIIINP